MTDPYRDTRQYWILKLSASPIGYFSLYWYCYSGMRISLFFFFFFWHVQKFLNIQIWKNAVLEWLYFIAKLNSSAVIIARLFVWDKNIRISYYEQQLQHQQKIRFEVLCSLFPLLPKTNEEEFISSIQSLFWKRILNVNLI